MSIIQHYSSGSARQVFAMFVSIWQFHNIAFIQNMNFILKSTNKLKKQENPNCQRHLQWGFSSAVASLLHCFQLEPVVVRGLNPLYFEYFWAHGCRCQLIICHLRPLCTSQFSPTEKWILPFWMSRLNRALAFHCRLKIMAAKPPGQHLLMPIQAKTLPSLYVNLFCLDSIFNVFSSS